MCVGVGQLRGSVSATSLSSPTLPSRVWHVAFRKYLLHELIHCIPPACGFAGVLYTDSICDTTFLCHIQGLKLDSFMEYVAKIKMF